ncbi:MAG: cytochrome c oxidase subunit 3 [Acidimicrobiia bacterium]
MASPTLALPSGERVVDSRATTLVTLLIGSAIVAAHGALIAAFLAVDDAIRAFPPKGTEPDNYTAVTIMITALMASACAEWAVWAVRNRERGHSLVAHGLHLGLAIACLNALWYLGSHLPFGVNEGAYATLVYAMFTLSGVAFSAAIGFMLFSLFRTAGAQADERRLAMPRAAAWFWHFTTLGWFGVFYTLYLFNLMFK